MKSQVYSVTIENNPKLSYIATYRTNGRPDQDTVHIYELTPSRAIRILAAIILVSSREKTFITSADSWLCWGLPERLEAMKRAAADVADDHERPQGIPFSALRSDACFEAAAAAGVYEEDASECEDNVLECPGCPYLPHGAEARDGEPDPTASPSLTLICPHCHTRNDHGQGHFCAYSHRDMTGYDAPEYHGQEHATILSVDEDDLPF